MPIFLHLNFESAHYMFFDGCICLIEGGKYTKIKTRAFILHVSVHWVDTTLIKEDITCNLKKKNHYKESSSIWHSVNWSQISLFNVLKNSLTSRCKKLNIKKLFSLLKRTRSYGKIGPSFHRSIWTHTHKKPLKMYSYKILVNRCKCTLK